jgi:hypothetical protein
MYVILKLNYKSEELSVCFPKFIIYEKCIILHIVVSVKI